MVAAMAPTSYRCRNCNSTVDLPFFRSPRNPLEMNFRNRKKTPTFPFSPRHDLENEVTLVLRDHAAEHYSFPPTDAKTKT